VQRLNLKRLRLPFTESASPVSKLRVTEVYLVVKSTLYFFPAHIVRLVRTVTEEISSRYGGVTDQRNSLLLCISR
jgi:hypothetical protein